MLRTLLAVGLCCTAVAFALDKPAPTDGVGAKVVAKLTGLDGKAADLADLRGKTATVVVFASTECPVSNSYASAVNELAKALAGKGVAVVVVIPSDEPVATVSKWATEYKLTVPVYLDPKKVAAAAFGAKATPEAFVLDADGLVRYRGRIDDAYSERLKKNPVVTSHDLQNALDDLLAGKPVRTAVTKPVGCPIAFDAAPAAKAGKVSYYKDVAPILQKHCQGCHRPGEVGPFSLTTYKQARQWSADIKQYTASRQMPPWMPAAGIAMKGERKLTDRELATIAAWVDAGSPEGDPKDAPPAADFGDGWKNGKPDLVLTVPDDFHVGATGPDIFRCFVVPTGLTENRWVVGYEVRPGNAKIVHHTLHFFDTTGTAREMEAKQQLKEKGASLADRGPGYPVSMGVGFVPASPTNKNGDPSLGGIGGWAPGQAGQFLPKGAGWLLPKGSDFIIQTHYHRDGKPGTDRTRIGLYFAKDRIEQPWQTVVLNGLSALKTIPAGTADYRSRGGVYLQTDAVLHSVMPHMHLLGKSVKVTMTPPGGKPVTLVEIPAWDYRWQETYVFKEPIAAKAGTRLEIEAVFDNSTANPNNPSRPPEPVSYGEQTTNEMLFGFIGATSTEVPSLRINTSAQPPADVIDGIVGDGEITALLEKRLGSWDGTMEAKLGGLPLKLAATELVEKSANGKYVRGKATNSADRRGLVTFAKYDAVAKQYRLWLYDGQGTALEFTGVHDEKAKTLTWTASPEEGGTVTMTWAFPADDKFEMKLTAKKGVATVFELSAAMTRKK